MYDKFVKLARKLLSHPLAILFVITVIFRLWFAFAHLTFGQDFARDLYLSQGFQEQGVVFVGYGPKASVGNFYLPPFYYQLLLVLTSISSWPLLITAVITIVEATTPILVFYILRDFTKKETALLGAFVYAFSGLAVTFGTFAWNPNMIPFFTTLSILLIKRYLSSGKLWELTVGILSVAIAFQLHYQVAVLMPFYIGLIVYTLLTKKFNFYHWLIAILIALIPFLPYLRTEVLDNFSNTNQIVKYFSEEHSKYYDRVSKISYITTYLPSFFERELTKINTPYLWLGRIILVLGMFSFFKLTRGKKAFIYFLYFVSIIISLRLYKGDKLDYYLATLFILPSILVAAMIEKNRLVGISISLIVVIGSIFSLSQVRIQNQFSDLKTTMRDLNDNFKEDSVRLVIHEIDFTNTMLFGLSKYTQISVDQSSLNVLDVCRTGEDCMVDNIYESKPQIIMNRYTQDLRKAGDYYQTYTLPGSDLPFRLYLGKFNKQPASIAHPFSSTYDLYGTDIINETVFQ